MLVLFCPAGCVGKSDSWVKLMGIYRLGKMNIPESEVTELFEHKHKTAVINIEEMHIICNMQIEEMYIL